MGEGEREICYWHMLHMHSTTLYYLKYMHIVHGHVLNSCRPSLSNQSLYRLIAGYQRGAGDHRVGQ